MKMIMKANKGLQMINLSAVHFLQVKSTTDLTIAMQYSQRPKNLKV